MKTWAKVALGVVGTLLVIGLLIPNSEEKNSAPVVAEEASEPEPRQISMEVFQAIETGMPLSEVEAMIGPGQLQSENELGGIRTQMFQWNDGMAGLSIIVQDGKVFQKSQFGLE